MEVLFEAFPFVFGVLLGLTCERLGRPRRRWPLVLVASIGLGALATLVSGEWRESPLYFLFDIGLVAAMSVATLAALPLLRGWLARR